MNYLKHFGEYLLRSPTRTEILMWFAAIAHDYRMFIIVFVLHVVLHEIRSRRRG